MHARAPLAAAALAALAAVFTSAAAAAEVTARWSELEIALWPEYDRSDVLIIYRGRSSAQALYPRPCDYPSRRRQANRTRGQTGRRRDVVPDPVLTRARRRMGLDRDRRRQPR